MLLLDQTKIAKPLDIIHDFDVLWYVGLHIINEQSFLKRQVRFNQILDYNS